MCFQFSRQRAPVGGSAQRMEAHRCPAGPSRPRQVHKASSAKSATARMGPHLRSQCFQIRRWRWSTNSDWGRFAAHQAPSVRGRGTQHRSATAAVARGTPAAPYVLPVLPSARASWRLCAANGGAPLPSRPLAPAAGAQGIVRQVRNGPHGPQAAFAMLPALAQPAVLLS